jgi:hypothetical protein
VRNEPNAHAATVCVARTSTCRRLNLACMMPGLEDLGEPPSLDIILYWLIPWAFGLIKEGV